MTVTLSQMRSKLLTIEQVTQRLQQTEPLVQDIIDSQATVRFRLASDWAHGIDALDNIELVDAFMSINGTERPMTKEALLQAASEFGLPGTYVKKVPAHFIEGLLNYHYAGGMGDKQFKVLSVGDTVAAFTRPTLTPFSNLELLERTVEGIQARYGADTEILADYKIMNTLQQTDVRLIVPVQQRIMQDTNMGDVPSAEDDVWMAGLHLTNSLVGRKIQTALEGYLFRWWCTNGATTEVQGAVPWSRRINGQEDNVYEWAREQVDTVLGGLEGAFDQVQSLAYLDVEHNIGEVLRQVWDNYTVPVTLREEVQDAIEQAEDLTMYTVMNAITQTANAEDLNPRRADAMMRIGGALPSESFDPLKAKIWREGHTSPTDVNPYEIKAVTA